MVAVTGRTAEGFDVQACRSCGRPIVWASTVTQRSMPVDADPSPGGTIELTATGHGVYASVVTVRDSAEPMRRTSHFATCPQADVWRGRGSGERR